MNTKSAQAEIIAILTACGANPVPVKNGVKVNAPKADGVGNMRLGDGYEKNRRDDLRYNVNGGRFIYYIDENCAIYYTEREAPTEPPRVWCPASMLTAHLMHLKQIEHRAQRSKKCRF